MRDNRMSPIRFSAARRGLPFGAYRHGTDDIRFDICQGLVCITRGKKRYVAPQMLFGVIETDETPSGYTIATYWHTDKDTPWLRRIYTLSTLRRFAFQNQLQETQRGLTYNDFVRIIREEYPDLQVPTIGQFYAQFGLYTAEAEEVQANDQEGNPTSR